MNEKAYLAGRAAAAREVMRCALNLMPGGLDRPAAAITMELTETRAALRSLCADLGDADWPEDLHLVDVIEKHVRPHITGDAPLLAIWISVAERLPEEDQSVLGCGPEGVAVVSRMPGSGVWCPFVEGYAPVITHWMPLPAPPSLLAIAPETDLPTGSVAGPMPSDGITWTGCSLPPEMLVPGKVPLVNMVTGTFERFDEEVARAIMQRQAEARATVPHLTWAEFVRLVDEDLARKEVPRDTPLDYIEVYGFRHVPGEAPEIDYEAHGSGPHLRTLSISG